MFPRSNNEFCLRMTKFSVQLCNSLRSILAGLILAKQFHRGLKSNNAFKHTLPHTLTYRIHLDSSTYKCTIVLQQYKYILYPQLQTKFWPLLVIYPVALLHPPWHIYRTSLTMVTYHTVKAYGVSMSMYGYIYTHYIAVLHSTYMACNMIYKDIKLHVHTSIISSSSKIPIRNIIAIFEQRSTTQVYKGIRITVLILYSTTKQYYQ